MRAGVRRAPFGLLAAGAPVLAAGAPLLAAGVAFVLARGTLLPGQGFWDTGEWQTVPPVFGTGHPTGYPTYTIVGWLASLLLAPTGEEALRMNLLSALLLATACGLVVVLVRGITGRALIGVAAGLLLALTPLPWRLGTFADPHTLHLAFTAGILILLLAWAKRRRAGAAGADRWLVASAGLYGVMLGNHTLTTLLAPGIALFVLAVEPGILRRPRLLGLCAVVLGASTVALYVQLPLRAAAGAPLVYGRPDTWDGFWYVVAAEQFRGDFSNPFGDLWNKAGHISELAEQQLGVLRALVPAAFLVVAVRRPRFALLTGTWMVVVLWFAASYNNGLIDRYYLGPTFIAVAWLGVAAGLVVEAAFPSAVAPAAAVEPGAGTDRGDEGPPDAATPGPGGSRLLASLVGLALAAGLLLPAALAAPATARQVDLARDTRASDWSRWVLAAVERRAVIVSWWSFSTPLWYRTLVLGERPDVWVVDDRDRLDEGLGSVDDVIRANLATRPVYLVRYPNEIAVLEAAWTLQAVPDPIGQQPLYRVLGPRTADARLPAAAGHVPAPPRAVAPPALVWVPPARMSP